MMRKSVAEGEGEKEERESCRPIHSGMDYTHIFFSPFFLLRLTNGLTDVNMFEGHCCP